MGKLNYYWIASLLVGSLCKFGADWLMFNTTFNSLTLYVIYGLGVILVDACIVFSAFFIFLNLHKAKYIFDIFRSNFCRIFGNL